MGSGAHHGTGEHFVVEADESDRSFLIYRPFVSIITNIEADHLNTYGDLATLEAAFAEFARLTDPAGFVVTVAPGRHPMWSTERREALVFEIPHKKLTPAPDGLWHLCINDAGELLCFFGPGGDS